jgi:hypothetical protein
MDARCSIAAAARREHGTDPLQQSRIVAGMAARPPALPGVKAGARHSVASAQGRYPAAIPLRRDEREDGALRAEQNRMAFFRSSCSSLSNAYRAFSSASCCTSRCSSAAGATSTT